MTARTGPDSAGPVLLARELGHDYHDLVALMSLDLEVSAGELVALVGANGAGKTTFLEAAAGLLTPGYGKIEICGFPAGSLEARAAVSYVPDAPVLYEDLSLNEHLEYIARIHGVDDWKGRGSRLLKRLDLAEWGDNLPTQFSRGMRQKASLAIGFVRPFRLLLADEPFDGLDPVGRGVLVELLQESCDSGAAVVVSTHRVEAADFASRCVALRDGEKAYDGAPDPAVIADLARHIPHSRASGLE